jgi:hypothetical protein
MASMRSKISGSERGLTAKEREGLQGEMVGKTAKKKSEGGRKVKMRMKS